MTNTTRGPPPRPDSDRKATPARERLVSVVVERDREPDECTIYPADATGEELMTNWMTAEAGSYVELDAMR